MVLGFMQKFPWGEPTHFKHKIWAGVEKTNYPSETPKIHTIREGQRWKVGMKIHMATGVRTKYYYQFNREMEGLEEVKGVQRIDIIHRGRECCLIFIDRKLFYSRNELFDLPFDYAKEHNKNGFLQFLQNDGLTEEQFWKWFKKPLRNGQLIHWTDLKY